MNDNLCRQCNVRTQQPLPPPPPPPSLPPTISLLLLHTDDDVSLDTTNNDGYDVNEWKYDQHQLKSYFEPKTVTTMETISDDGLVFNYYDCHNDTIMPVLIADMAPSQCFQVNHGDGDNSDNGATGREQQQPPQLQPWPLVYYDDGQQWQSVLSCEQPQQQSFVSPPPPPPPPVCIHLVPLSPKSGCLQQPCQQQQQQKSLATQMKNTIYNTLTDDNSANWQQELAPQVQHRQHHHHHHKCLRHNHHHEQHNNSAQLNNHIIHYSETNQQQHLCAPMSEQQSTKKWIQFDVYLDLAEHGLGMSIRGGADSLDRYGKSDVYVSRILVGGAVHKDGRLQIGDILLQVNGISLVHVPHRVAVDHILKAAPYVHFIVKRANNTYLSDQTTDMDEEEDETSSDPNEPLLWSSGENYVYGDDYDDYIENNLSGTNHGVHLNTNHNDWPNNNNNNNNTDECIKVELVRDRNGFGFSLIDGTENNRTTNKTQLHVSKLVQNGPAHRNGLIQVGDQIVAINDTNLEHVSYDWALSIIRNSPAFSVFTVRKKFTWD